MKVQLLLISGAICIIFSKADITVYDDVISGEINQQSYKAILNKDYEVGVGSHLQVNSSHVVNASNADTEAYDDVVSEKSNRPIYETIPNEVGIGTHLQVNSSRAAETHTVTTTNADVAATRKENVTTTSTPSVAMQSNPAYGAVIGEGIVTAATTVTMEPNPAYVVNTTQLESGSLV